jgi:hypothetical protein
LEQCKILSTNIKPTNTRRGASSLYLGAWKRYKNEPAWTADSHHGDTQQEDIDNFLQISTPAFKYVQNILKQRFPDIYDRYIEANKNISLHDQEHYQERPYAPYATLTVNVDKAVTMHKDWEGDIYGMECIIVLGDWTIGGELILEDVNACIVLKPGDIYFLNSANIFHYVNPHSGGLRYSLVMFTDKTFI